MEHELEHTDKFFQTFGGEQWIDDWYCDEYGFTVGDLSVYNIKSVELSRLACAAINHLMLNGHCFELCKTECQDAPIEFREVAQ